VTDPGAAQMLALRRQAEATPLPETLGDFVRERAAALGDAPLGNWFEAGRILTYRGLDESADKLASSLLGLGVRKGCHVAVMLPNGPEFPITWVALARLGAVMVPVNTAYTPRELAFVLADSDSQFLVIHHAFLPVLDSAARPEMLGDANVIVCGGAAAAPMRSWDALHDEGAAPFVAPSAVSRTDLLNLQYTSGTTGFPKGCLLSHDYWMIIALNAATLRMPPGEVRNVLIWAPFFYMDPMWQFLMTMRLGGTAFIAERISLRHLFDWLEQYRIHYCVIPEPALKQHPPGPQDARLSLKVASIYGWRAEARRELEQRFGILAREGYGMTEIGNCAVVPLAAGEKAYSASCGIVSPFREVRILDEDGQELPPGEIGELWVRGRSILWGYHKRPQANAESFRGEWFRTGDLFRRDADGYLFIVGRIKDMIKRAGENIAANEVEAVLREMPEIEEAAVLAVPDDTRREEVKACLKLRDGLTPQDVPPEAVAAHCAARLARFKIPRYLAYVADFPRTPSRKIAKKELRAAPDLIAGAYDLQEKRWR
jgi:long-chain acyl-CoA synthetase/crotonobetaine/carnitine-CoA ligase